MNKYLKGFLVFVSLVMCIIIFAFPLGKLYGWFTGENISSIGDIGGDMLVFYFGIIISYSFFITLFINALIKSKAKYVYTVLFLCPVVLLFIFSRDLLAMLFFLLTIVFAYLLSCLFTKFLFNKKGIKK